MRMSTFLNDLPGEMSDPIPNCFNCGYSGTYNNFVGEQDFCDCASGEVAHSNWCGDHDAQQARRDEAEYQAGIALGERYSMERKMFGDTLANEWAMEDELNDYNNGLI